MQYSVTDLSKFVHLTEKKEYKFKHKRCLKPLIFIDFSFSSNGDLDVSTLSFSSKNSYEDETLCKSVNDLSSNFSKWVFELMSFYDLEKTAVFFLNKEKEQTFNCFCQTNKIDSFFDTKDVFFLFDVFSNFSKINFIESLSEMCLFLDLSENEFFPSENMVRVFFELLKSGYYSDSLFWSNSDEFTRFKSFVLLEEGMNPLESKIIISFSRTQSTAWDEFLKWSISFVMLQSEYTSRKLNSEEKKETFDELEERMFFLEHSNSMINQMIQDFNIWSDLDSDSQSIYETEITLMDQVLLTYFFGLWNDFLNEMNFEKKTKQVSSLLNVVFNDSFILENFMLFHIWSIEMIKHKNTSKNPSR